MITARNGAASKKMLTEVVSALKEKRQMRAERPVQFVQDAARQEGILLQCLHVGSSGRHGGLCGLQSLVNTPLVAKSTARNRSSSSRSFPG